MNSFEVGVILIGSLLRGLLVDRAYARTLSQKSVGFSPLILLAILSSIS